MAPGEILPSGFHLGPYRVEAAIGAGGMGAVYRARDTRIGRTVAVKVLSRNPVSGANTSRALQEARAVSALNHPNIVTLYDIGREGDIEFLVLEYLAGKTLKETIPSTGLPLADLVHYGAQVARALEAAHRAGITHRDIKPANIMVMADSHVKVLDFGLAKLREGLNPGPDAETRTLADAVQTTPGTIVGTVFYMSPEQISGQELDGRSDLFSLGCVLYEAATGRLPFQGPTIVAVMHHITSEKPPSPSSIRPELPAQFDRLIEQALAKDRNARFSSAAEMLAAMQALLDRPAVGPPPPPAVRDSETFVGRESEMDELGALFRNAVHGRGKIVFITGGPGLGKSAMLSEFLSRTARNHPQLLAGRGACVEQYGAGEAYLPFLEALSALLNGGGGERVHAVLRRYAPAWCLQFPAAFGSTDSLEQLQRQAIGATKERMLREFGDAVGALAASEPVLLLLEDLHWSDPASIDLLRHLGSRVAGQRLLVVATLRPEDVEHSQHPLRNCMRELHAHRYSEQIALGPLRLEHLQAYLSARFAPNDFPAGFAPLVYSKTEGHPLFSAALIQLLAQRGDIAIIQSRWTITHPLRELGLEIPQSVLGMIRKKLEVLDEDDRRALQYASVEGEEFTSTVIAAMLGVDELALEHRLDQMDRVHKLIETHGEQELPDGSLAMKYRFAHALFQNVLYSDLLSKHRILLHRQAGEQLLRHYGEQTDSIAGALASHFERGREYGRAIQYLIQAAEVAVKRYADAAASDHYTRALLLAEKLAKDEQTRTEITLLHKRGSVRLALGRMEEMEADFTRMLEQARALGDRAQECTALNALTNPFLFLYSRATDEMSARAEAAHKLAEQIGDGALRAEAMVNVALKHSLVGDPLRAKELFEGAISVARSAGQGRALLVTLTYRGIGHFFQTEFQPAEAMLSEAAELASRLRDGVMLRTALFFLGLTRGSLGRIEDALSTLQEAAEMARRNGDTLILVRADRGIAWIHLELQDFQYKVPRDPEADRKNVAAAEVNWLMGRIGDGSGSEFGKKSVEASREVEAIHNYDSRSRWQFSGVRFQASAAEYWLAQRDLARAEECAQSLLANSTSHGPAKYVSVAHKLLGEIAQARGDLTTAEQELSSAVEVFRTNPAPLVAWKTYAALGRICRLKGDSEGARKAFGQSAEIVRAIASTVPDETLRSTFLNAAAVQQVLCST